MRALLFELKEGLIIALKAIRANKIRAILTTLEYGFFLEPTIRSP